MAVFHLLYRSLSAGAVPLAGNMPDGRLALNLADERIYFRNSIGVVTQPNIRPASRLPTGAHDLNTYRTPGSYFQASSVGATTGSNYPTAAAGFLEVVGETGSTGTMQRYTVRATTGPNMVEYVRNLQPDDTSWTVWEARINVSQKAAVNGVASLGADGKVPFAQLPTNITTVQVLPTTAHDLNTYTTTSDWYQTTNAGATAGTNYPVARAGFLEIIATGTPVMQVYTTRDGAGSQQQFFRCQITGGNYSPWQEVANSYNTYLYQGSMASAQDLNTYLFRGTWAVPTSAIAAGGTNFPAPYSGVFQVLSGGVLGSGATITSGVTQVYYSANNNATYSRSLITGVWTDWAQTGSAGLLPTTAHDLNSYAAPGTFFQNADAGATTGTNYPVANAGMLSVKSSVVGSNLMVVQEYVSLPVGASRLFRRIRFGSALTWYPWSEVTSLTAQTSTTDTTAGRVQVVGAFGAGGYAPNLTAYGFGTDLNLIDSISCLVTIDANVTNGPSGAGSLAYTSVMRVQRRQFAAGVCVSQEMFLGNGDLWSRVGTGAIGSTTWTNWVRCLTSAEGQAYNHVFLTAATDANTLTADNTYYTWTASAVTLSGTNWVQPAGSGYLRVYRAAATFVIQELYLASSSSKPRLYSRYGNATTGVWESWRSVGAHSATTNLPTSGDCGDIYVDGSGWYSWNGSAYAARANGAPLVTNAATAIAVNSVSPGSYTRTTAATAVTANVNTTTAAFIGTEWHFRQAAAGAITFVAGSGVTINPPLGGSLSTGGVGSTVTLKCVATGAYDLFGQTESA